MMAAGGKACLLLKDGKIKKKKVDDISKKVFGSLCEEVYNFFCITSFARFTQ